MERNKQFEERIAVLADQVKQVMDEYEDSLDELRTEMQDQDSELYTSEVIDRVQKSVRHDMRDSFNALAMAKVTVQGSWMVKPTMSQT